MERNIVILAKSAKQGNFCIAGIDVTTGEWIRPISKNPKYENAVPIYDIFYENKEEMQILDLVRINFLDEQCNNNIQPENMYYDASVKFIKINQTNLNRVLDIVKLQNRDLIFYNSERKITPKNLPSNSESLLFLKIKNVYINKNEHGRIFANFSYNNVDYERISIGDINIRELYKSKDVGFYKLSDESIVVLSLTNPFRDGFCYKILAQIF